MKLRISFKNLVRLVIKNAVLECHDSNGNVITYSVEEITVLDCSFNQLQSLPELPSTLKELNCFHNQLENLSSLPNKLEVLECSNNRLQSLPTLPNSLKALHCSVNRLQSLPKLPREMIVLDCFNNHLKSLPKLPSTGLEVLDCQLNPLIFVQPLAKRPHYYEVPEHLVSFHSSENYPNYCRKYQTYFYLITYLALHLGISTTLLSNENFWFPGIV